MGKILIVILFLLMFIVSGCEEDYVGKRIPQESPEPDEWSTPSVYDLEVGESTLGVELITIDINFGDKSYYCILEYDGETYTIYEKNIEILNDGKIIGVVSVFFNGEDEGICEIVLEHQSSKHRTYEGEIYTSVEVEEIIEYYDACWYNYYDYVGNEETIFVNSNGVDRFNSPYLPGGESAIVTTLEVNEPDSYCDIVVIPSTNPEDIIELPETPRKDYSLKIIFGDGGFEVFSLESFTDNLIMGISSPYYFPKLKAGPSPLDLDFYVHIDSPSQPLIGSATHTYSDEGFYQTSAQIISEKTGEILYSTPPYLVASLPNTQIPFSEELNLNQNYLEISYSRFFSIGAINFYHYENSFPYEQEINFEDWGFNVAIIDPLELLGFPSEIYKFYTSLSAATNDLHDNQFYSEDELILSSIVPESGKLIGWWNKDEPVWLGYDIEPIAEAYNLLKQTDPSRPVWMNFAQAHPSDNLQEYISDVREFSQYADIISVDVYPVHNSCDEDSIYCVLENPEISVIGDFVDLYKQQILYDTNKPFWIILQGHGDTLTYNQLRFMSYQSIIHGATGIFYYFWWGFGGERYPEDLRLVTNQLSDLQNVITTHFEERQINTEDGIEYLKIFYEDELYIISVNRNNQVTQKTFNIDSTNTPITVLYEDRTLNTNNQGEFTDTFQPFDTHIYKISLSCGWGNFGEPTCHANDISSQNNRNSCRNNIGCYPDSITDRDCILDENYCRNQAGFWKCQTRSCELQ